MWSGIKMKMKLRDYIKSHLGRSNQLKRGWELYHKKKENENKEGLND